MEIRGAGGAGCISHPAPQQSSLSFPGHELLHKSHSDTWDGLRKARQRLATWFYPCLGYAYQEDIVPLGML